MGFGEGPDGADGGNPLATLLQRIACGDESALGDFYDRTSARVHGLARRLLGDHQDAEEVTVDVYRQVWDQASRFTTTRGQALTWLMMLARSRSLDRLRRRVRVARRERPLDEAGSSPSPDAGPDERGSLAEHGLLVRAALATLPDEQRQAIELAYAHGLSHTEIAERLNSPLGTVKTRIRRGIGSLRDALANGHGRDG